MVVELSFFYVDTETTEIYTSSHTFPYTTLFRSHPHRRDDAPERSQHRLGEIGEERHDRRQRLEEHTSELQSRELISYAVFCLKKKKKNIRDHDVGGADFKSATFGSDLDD